MKPATVASEKLEFQAALTASRQGPVVVTRKGKPVAVMLSIRSRDDYERFLLAQSPKFRRIIKKSDRQLAAGQGISHDKFWASLTAR